MKAFSLVNAPHLPVTGESHPLVRESIRWLSTGNAIALLGALLVFGGLYAWSQMDPEEPPVVKMPGAIVFDDVPTPPRIVEEPRGSDEPQAPVTPPEIAVPIPVDREVEGDLPTLDEIRNWFDREGPGDDPIEVNPGGTGEIPTKPYAVFDELPVLLSMGEPVYPDLAREAGIDGTVLVKVLVTRAGKVQDAVAVEGPEPLRKSAVDAARTALFKPAMQGDNPVEVWVMIPITFSLSR